MTATTIHLYADADFAGESSKTSMSRVHVVMRGPHTNFPMNSRSKRLGCVRQSTPETEIVAADLAVRTEGIPALFGMSWRRAMALLCSTKTTKP